MSRKCVFISLVLPVVKILIPVAQQSQFSCQSEYTWFISECTGPVFSKQEACLFSLSKIVHVLWENVWNYTQSRKHACSSHEDCFLWVLHETSNFQECRALDSSPSSLWHSLTLCLVFVTSQTSEGGIQVTLLLQYAWNCQMSICCRKFKMPKHVSY